MQTQQLEIDEIAVYEDNRVKATLLHKDQYSTSVLLTPFGVQDDYCHFFEFQPGNARFASWEEPKINTHKAMRGTYLTLEDNCDRRAVVPFISESFPCAILPSRTGRTLENAVEAHEPAMDTGDVSDLFAPIEVEIHQCFPNHHGGKLRTMQRCLKHVMWDDIYRHCWPYNFKADIVRGFLRMLTTYAAAHAINTTEENNRFGYSKRAYEELKDHPHTQFRCNLRQTSGIIGYAGMLAAAAGAFHFADLPNPAIGLMATETIMSLLNSLFKGQPTSVIGTLRDFCALPTTRRKATFK